MVLLIISIIELRYPMAIDDNGQGFELDPDPLLDSIKPYISKFQLGADIDAAEVLRSILENENVCGVDLYTTELAKLICSYFEELIAGALYGILKFNDCKKALEYGNAASVVKNTIPGDMPSSDLKEIEKIIADHKDRGGMSEMER